MLEVNNKLETIKKMLRDSFFKNDLVEARSFDIYLEPFGKNNVYDEKEKPFSVMQCLKEFIEHPAKKSLLVLGDSGMGKTLLSLYVAKQVWEEKLSLQQDILPLYIYLPAMVNKNGELSEKLLETHLKENCSLRNEEYIDYLRDHKVPLLLILDGFDEIKWPGNLYTQNGWNKWNIKLLCTCRPEAFVNYQNYQQYFVSLSEIYLCSFNNQQKSQYIKKYLQELLPNDRKFLEKTHNKWLDTETYLHAIETLPGLKELVETPFILSMAVQILPEIKKIPPKKNVEPLSETATYDLEKNNKACVQNNFSQESERYGLFKYKQEGYEQEKDLLENTLNKDYKLGIAVGKGDDFYDAVSEALNEALNTHEYTLKGLRLLCHEYVMSLDKRFKFNKETSWIANSFNDELKYYEYMGNVQYTAEECENGSGLNNENLCKGGEQHLDGRIICEQFKENNINLHIIEVKKNSGYPEESKEPYIIRHNLVTTNGLLNVDENEINWNSKNIIHLAVDSNHFVPILRQHTLQEVNISKKELHQKKNNNFEDDKNVESHLEDIPKDKEEKEDIDVVSFEISSEPINHLTRAELYRRFTQRWFEKQSDRLQKQKKFTQIKGYLAGYLSNYAKNLALDRLSQGKLETAIDPKDTLVLYLLVPKDRELLESFTLDQEILEKNIEDIRSGCLLKTHGKKFQFLHKSLLEYLASEELLTGALGLVQNGMHNLKAEYAFQEQLLVDEPQIILRLAELAQKDNVFKDALWQLIMLSKKENYYSISAANSITIWNRAGFSLAGKDLKKIKISGADLRSAILHYTDFTNADLSRVLLQHSYLGNANLQGACLSHVNFGELARLDVVLSKTARIFRGTEKLYLSPDKKYLVLCNRIEICVFDIYARKQLWHKKIYSSMGPFMDEAGGHHRMPYIFRVFLPNPSIEHVLFSKDSKKLILIGIAFEPNRWDKNEYTKYDIITYNLIKGTKETSAVKNLKVRGSPPEQLLSEQEKLCFEQKNEISIKIGEIHDKKYNLELILNENNKCIFKKEINFDQIAISPNRFFLAVLYDSIIDVWDINKQQPVYTIKLVSATSCFIFIDDFKICYRDSSSRKEELCFIDLKLYMQNKTDFYNSEIKNIVNNEIDEILVTISQMGSYFVFEGKSKKEIRAYDKKNKYIVYEQPIKILEKCIFSFCEKYLLTWNDSSSPVIEFKIIDLLAKKDIVTKKAKNYVKELPEEQKCKKEHLIINDMQFSENEIYIIYSCYTGNYIDLSWPKIDIIDNNTGNLIRRLFQESNMIIKGNIGPCDYNARMYFLKNTNSIITVSENYHITLWNLKNYSSSVLRKGNSATSKLRSIFSLKFDFIGIITSSAVSQSDLVLAVAGKGLGNISLHYTIIIWSILEKKIIQEIALDFEVAFLVFNFDDSRLIAYDRGGKSCFLHKTIFNNLERYILKDGQLGLFAEATNIQDVFGLSENNFLLLQQLNAIGTPSKEKYWSQNINSTLFQSAKPSKKSLKNIVGDSVQINHIFGAVSLVRSRDGNHAFFLIEVATTRGIKIYFADLTTRGGVLEQSFSRAKAKIILELWRDDPTFSKLKEKVKIEFVYKTFQVPLEKVNQLYSSIEQDKNKEIYYSMSGGIFNISDSEYKNCLTWCLSKLKEIGIEEPKQWLPSPKLHLPEIKIDEQNSKSNFLLFNNYSK